jgi:hypothetical protein
MKTDEWQLWVSLWAFIISILALLISWYTSQRSAVSGRRPVLVFVYDTEKGWRVRNIGNGPALDIVIAKKRIGGAWFDPVRIPPLPADGEFALTWCRFVNDVGLGATYFDIAAMPYSSKCGNDLSVTEPGRMLPAWKEENIRRHWNHPDSNA